MKFYLYNLNETKSFRNQVVLLNILYILHIDDVDISVFHVCSVISSIRRCIMTLHCMVGIADVTTYRISHTYSEIT